MNKWRFAANRLQLDYRAEAHRLGPPVRPIVDAHSHINGAEAAAVFKDVCDLYGVQREVIYLETDAGVWSQLQLGSDELRELHAKLIGLCELLDVDVGDDGADALYRS